MDANQYTELQQALGTMATLLFEYYTSLINSGFSEELALFLTSKMQDDFLSKHSGKGGEE